MIYVDVVVIQTPIVRPFRKSYPTRNISTTLGSKERYLKGNILAIVTPVFTTNVILILVDNQRVLVYEPSSKTVYREDTEALQ